MLSSTNIRIPEMMLIKSSVHTARPVCLYGPFAALCVKIVIGTTQAAAIAPIPNVATITIPSVIQFKTAAAVYMPLVPEEGGGAGD